MKIIIIPGFTGYPEQLTFKDLEMMLESEGHTVIKIAWPYFPDDLHKYSISATLESARKVVKSLDTDDIAILGFSMGGIIATVLASEFIIKKLGLIASPYHAGSDSDLAGKYKQWKEDGYRDLSNSKHGKFRVPFSFIVDAKKYNALELISHVSCSKLFITAELDNKTPFEQSKLFFDTASEPKVWHQIPGMEHNYHYQQDMLKKVNDIIVEFIEANT